MSKQDAIKLSGVVVEAMRGATFRVRIDGTDKEILCTIAGRMRTNFIRVLPGDKVDVEISPYDLTKGRITYRHR